MPLATELQIHTTGGFDGNDLYALIRETIAARLLDTRGNVFIARDAEILYLLRHKIIDDNQCLGVKGIPAIVAVTEDE